ncbi:UMP kinase [Candidatus Liberibacter americanus]|uniref:Uridylate kinase n=1 Tax=Candidatus Liberibacter americanus str. Sao Paulo TaxID=1261131 RepID=U6B733_9HYPH|nr:UMP kinase [Candidatus Liberibacter americanus]AHA27557.1 Uridylate kinase [Candidatus Liberibacter americanus str. Sao Paulo]EMS36482.1 uridylate kinase [Candidatus Liberibacter americanus PW_SP]
MSGFKYKRILLKVSGESLAGGSSFRIDLKAVDRICADIAEVHSKGVEIGIVIGGGNIFRGSKVVDESLSIERPTADNIGMLSTVINSLVLCSALRKINIPTKVLSSIFMPQICEVFSYQAALSYIAQGCVVVFSGGTGNSLLTTDSAASLRAIEIKADVILKGTQVDGVYSSDPIKDDSALRFDNLTYNQVIEKELKIMDATSIVIARDSNIPIIVFSIHSSGGILGALSGLSGSTIISGE